MDTMRLEKIEVKKIIKIIGLFLGLTVILYVTWFNLPVTINRYSDIKFADKIIEKIEEYKKSKGLPESDDWETLKKFGFKEHADFLVPEYQKINKDNYELRFIEGFDGPYLLWNSKERKWKIGQPTFPDERTKNK